MRPDDCSASKARDEHDLAACHTTGLVVELVHDLRARGEVRQLSERANLAAVRAAMSLYRIASVILRHAATAAIRAQADIEELAAADELRVARGLAMNASEAARYLGVPERTVRDACTAGLIPSRRLGRTYVISERALMTWIEGGTLVPRQRESQGGAA